MQRTISISEPPVGSLGGYTSPILEGSVVYLDFQPGTGLRYPLIISVLPDIESGGDEAVLLSLANHSTNGPAFASIVTRLGQLWHISYVLEKFERQIGEEACYIYCALLNWVTLDDEVAHAHAQEIWDEAKEKWNWPK